jgi:hypothetical protein
VYGEAFRQHKGHPYPHENLLAALCGNVQPAKRD